MSEINNGQQLTQFEESEYNKILLCSNFYLNIYSAFEQAIIEKLLLNNFYRKNYVHYEFIQHDKLDKVKENDSYIALVVMGNFILDKTLIDNIHKYKILYPLSKIIGMNLSTKINDNISNIVNNTCVLTTQDNFKDDLHVFDLLYLNNERDYDLLKFDNNNVYYLPDIIYLSKIITNKLDILNRNIVSIVFSEYDFNLLSPYKQDIFVENIIKNIQYLINKKYKIYFIPQTMIPHNNSNILLYTIYNKLSCNIKKHIKVQCNLNNIFYKLHKSKFIIGMNYEMTCISVILNKPFVIVDTNEQTKDYMHRHNLDKLYCDSSELNDHTDYLINHRQKIKKHLYVLYKKNHSESQIYKHIRLI